MADGTGFDPSSAIEKGLGTIQAGVGIVQAISARKKQRNLLNQRKTFQTPDGIFDILNATENNLQGYDSQSLNYFTNQLDQSFASTLGVAERSGADANVLSAIFNQKINGILDITEKSHLARMDQFSSWVNAKSVLAANKAAEQKSKEDLLRDKIQAEGLNLQAATGNISGGINTILSSLSNDQIGKLYNPDGTLKSDSSGGLNPNTQRITTKVF